MVPTGRLELPRPKSLPPQDSVSTNSTTWAIGLSPGWVLLILLRNVTRFRAAVLARNLRGCGRLRCCSRYGCPFKHAGRLVLLEPVISQAHAGQEKQGCQDGGAAAQKIGRTGGTEQTSCRSAAKSCAHVSALSMLQQYQCNHRNRSNNMNNPNQCFHNFDSYLAAARQIATNSSATKDAPPIRPPSISG